MYKIDKLLVALDLTNMDELLIRYASFLVKVLDVKEIRFAHIMEGHDVPEDIKNLYPDLDPLEKVVEKELQEKVDRVFGDQKNVKTNIHVLDGGVTDTLIEWAREEAIDLALMGKKTGFKGKGILSGKIVRLIHCSVLFIPETVPFSIDKILVPVDFSRYSRMALEEALKIGEKTGAKVLCQHVYTIPRQYFPYIPSEKNVRESVEKSVSRSFKKFIDKVARGREDVRCLTSYDPDSDAGQKIYDQAIQEQADMIVMGSKGRTDAASVLLGSTAEKLAGYEKSLPIFIVKDKEENYGFLDALFGRGK